MASVSIKAFLSFPERNTNILIYIKRRLGMCARKLGKLREATKIFRDLVKEFPMMSVFNIHENLIEVLLALQNYPDVQGVLAKYDGSNFVVRFTVRQRCLSWQISACRNRPRFATQLRCSKPERLLPRKLPLEDLLGRIGGCETIRLVDGGTTR